MVQFTACPFGNFTLCFVSLIFLWKNVESVWLNADSCKLIEIFKCLFIFSSPITEMFLKAEYVNVWPSRIQKLHHSSRCFCEQEQTIRLSFSLCEVFWAVLTGAQLGQHACSCSLLFIENLLFLLFHYWPVKPFALLGCLLFSSSSFLRSAQSCWLVAPFSFICLCSCAAAHCSSSNISTQSEFPPIPWRIWITETKHCLVLPAFWFLETHSLFRWVFVGIQWFYIWTLINFWFLCSLVMSRRVCSGIACFAVTSKAVGYKESSLLWSEVRGFNK